MSNMSYCRFRNTLHDLQDCQEALESLFQSPDEETELSDDELRAAAKLVDVCFDIAVMVMEQAGQDIQFDLDILEEAKCALGVANQEASEHAAQKRAEEEKEVEQEHQAQKPSSTPQS